MFTPQEYLLLVMLLYSNLWLVYIHLIFSLISFANVNTHKCNTAGYQVCLTKLLIRYINLCMLGYAHIYESRSASNKAIYFTIYFVWSRVLLIPAHRTQLTTICVMLQSFQYVFRDAVCKELLKRKPETPKRSTVSLNILVLDFLTLCPKWVGPPSSGEKSQTGISLAPILPFILQIYEHVRGLRYSFLFLTRFL